MGKKNKHKRILILMVTSQLLLTGFVIQWLVAQYRAEKGLLLKELSGFYIKSQDQVLDTLLFKTFIDPVLSENEILLIDRKLKKPDSTHIQTIVLSGNQTGKGRIKMDDSTLVSVKIEQRNDSGSIKTTTAGRMGLPDEMLIKSVRLIIAHSGDTISTRNREMNEFSSRIDTAKFKKIFYARLGSNNMKFVINWHDSMHHSVLSKKLKSLSIKPVQGVSLPEANVEGYGSYLLRKIMPQTIFGFILVFITGIAFFVSYRSMRDHMILNSLRDEFVNNITHELKTPVSTIMIALEALGNFDMRNEPDVMKEYIGLASVETKRLAELINRVLDHSLLEKKGHPMVVSDIDVNSTTEAVVDIMRQKLGPGGKIHFTHGNEKLTIRGDQLFIKGVLINLIDNSIRYCDKDPVIKIITGEQDDNILITIEDNGPGIPEEYQKRIFEKFFRLPTENVHNVKGYGLGLSFASLVMELHKGTIEVRNLQQGCSFELKFPKGR